MKTIDVDGMPHLCLFAIKDIDPGKEITYNYGNADWPWRQQVQGHRLTEYGPTILNIF